MARLLKLGYPGGPAIDQAATRGNPKAFVLPEGVVAGYDFSFSGLKTAVLRTVENHRSKFATDEVLVSAPFEVNQPSHLNVDDLAASFQDAVNRVLFRKTMLAAEKLGLDRVVLAGGVAANTDLRRRFEEAEKAVGIRLYRPAPSLCTDNAAMVAAAAYYSGQPVPLSVSAYSRRY